MVGGDSEGHELLERHLVLGIDVEEPGRDRSELEALLDDAWGYEETSRDFLLAQARVAEVLEGPELVERMEGDALDVLGQAVFLRRPAFAHDAGHGLCLGHALLLDEQFERPEAPAAGRDLVHAGLGALDVQHRPHAEALQQGAAGDVLGQVLDRDASLHPAHIRLGQHQLVEGNVLGPAQDDLGIGGCHVGSP